MNTFDPIEHKNQIISGVVTVLIIAIIVTVLCVIYHYPPDPPIPERGVEVAMGNTDFGEGDEQMAAENESSMSAASSAPSTNENVSTQRSEESISVPPKTEKTTKSTQQVTPKPTTPTDAPKNEEPKKEPEVNQKALFKGGKVSNNSTATNGGSSGSTSGSGNKGKPDGNPNSKNYNGSGGAGSGSGTGAEYSLANRGVKDKPKPSTNNGIEGWIIVNIQVNRNGVVTNATIGKTQITDKTLQNEALRAARNTTFKPDPTAPEVQSGTIKYIYRNN